MWTSLESVAFLASPIVFSKIASAVVADVDNISEITIRVCVSARVCTRKLDHQYYPTEQLVEPSARPGLYLDLALPPICVADQMRFLRLIDRSAKRRLCHTWYFTYQVYLQNHIFEECSLNGRSRALWLSGSTFL